jgi:hypothetical protein
MSTVTLPSWLLPLLLPLALGSCASKSARPFDGELAPFPYTARQIRRANPPKTVLVYRMEGLDRSFLQTMSFLPSGEPGRATTQVKRMSEGGSLLTQPVTSTETWEELRDHASFPAALTIRTEERVDIPAGHFDCWLYTVRQ